MFEERYERMMEGVEPSPELLQRTLQAGKARRTRTAAWKPVLVAALCVLLVAGAAAWRVMNTGSTPLPVTTRNDVPAIRPASDELTLSISDVTLVSEHELTFILTLQGDQLDPLTSIDYRLEGLRYAGSSYMLLEPSEGQPSDVQRFLFTLTRDDRPILEGAEDTLQLSIPWYTSGDTQTETIHDIDWSTVTAAELPRVGSPLIPLGGDVALTALAYTEADGLSVQLRWPQDSCETTMAFPQLVRADTGEYPDKFIPWATTQYTAEGYILHNTTFQVTRSELADLRLITYTSLTGRVITGDWRTTIDLTALKGQ